MSFERKIGKQLGAKFGPFPAPRISVLTSLPALQGCLNSCSFAAPSSPLQLGFAQGSGKPGPGRGWLSLPGAAVGSGHCCPQASALSRLLAKVRAEPPSRGGSSGSSERCGAPRRVSEHGCDELKRTLQGWLFLNLAIKISGYKHGAPSHLEPCMYN